MTEAAASTLEPYDEVHHEVPAIFLWKYVFSTDHKMIARQYIFIALLWALVGGMLAYMMRWQPGDSVEFPKTANSRLRAESARKCTTLLSPCTGRSW